MAAAADGEDVCAILLLHYGASTSLVDKQGYDASSWAKKEQNHRYVCILTNFYRAVSLMSQESLNCH